MEKERTIIFKRKENTPYDFNINEEYKKYESIGDNKSELKTYNEYSRAMKSHFRKFGNQMSGSGNHLCNYASLLA